MTKLKQVQSVLMAHGAYNSYRHINTDELAERFVEDVNEADISDSSWSMAFESFETNFASFWEYQQEWRREYRSMYS